MKAVQIRQEQYEERFIGHKLTTSHFMFQLECICNTEAHVPSAKPLR